MFSAEQKAKADNSYLLIELIIPDITKTSSYNCLKVNPVRQFRVEIENIERFRVNITIDQIMAYFLTSQHASL